MISFQDIIKDSFLEFQQFGSVSVIEFLISMLISFMLGLLIYFVYSKCFRGVVYSHNYNISFVIITMLTTVIILTISTNIVLSLGMVGALSIVRFRTAVKDPLDIVYMFWAIAAGIATGAKIYPIAIIGSIIVALVIFWLSKKSVRQMPYLLIVHYEEAAHPEVIRVLRKLKYKLKSKTIRKDVCEMTVEITIKDDNTAFMNELNEIEQVRDVSLVSYNGDYAL